MARTKAPVTYPAHTQNMKPHELNFDMVKNAMTLMKNFGRAWKAPGGASATNDLVGCIVVKESLTSCILPFSKVQDTLEANVLSASGEKPSAVCFDQLDFDEVSGFVEQIRCFCDKLHKCADSLEDAGFYSEEIKDDSCKEARGGYVVPFLTQEQVVEQIGEDSKTEGKEESKEESEKEVNEELDEQSKEESSENLEEGRKEELKKELKEKPNEEPKEEPGDELNKEPNEEPKEEPKEKSKEEPLNKLKEDVNEDSDDDSHEKSKSKHSVSFLTQAEESPSKKMRTK